MDRDIFRAFSIRGVVGQNLDAETMRRIGQALGTYVLRRGGRAITVGRDGRTSSPELGRALVGGLLSTGVNVIDIGLTPTPVLNFATDYYGTYAGATVTASHNPPQYNGLKIRTDYPLRGSELALLCEMAEREDFIQGQGGLRAGAPLEAYLSRIRERVRISCKLKVVVDGGNGTNGPVVLKLLDALGCEAVPLFCEIDGTFPNRHPDPTVPGSLDALSKTVLRERADLGLAYDGDGDRLAIVDDRGEIVLADRLAILFARHILRERPGAKFVFEITCTRALREDLEARGGNPIPCPVGYAFVQEKMRAEGAAFGVEMSGHIFFDDPLLRFDDAIFASARFLEILAAAEKPLSALLSDIPHYPSTPVSRYPCPDRLKGAIVERLKIRLAERYKVDEMDGVLVEIGDRWGLVRPSHTQPAISVKFEAHTAEGLKHIEGLVLEELREAFFAEGLEFPAPE